MNHINHLKVSRVVLELCETYQKMYVFSLPGLHAALGASEARSAGAAALVQGTIEALPSTLLPEVQVLAVGASTTFHLGVLIFILCHQGIMVVSSHGAGSVPGCNLQPRRNRPPPRPPRWSPACPLSRRQPRSRSPRSTEISWRTKRRVLEKVPKHCCQKVQLSV